MPSPGLAGGAREQRRVAERGPRQLVALRKGFFQDIGGYDDAVFMGSSSAFIENVELSLKIWLCGGSLLQSGSSDGAQSAPRARQVWRWPLPKAVRWS